MWTMNNLPVDRISQKYGFKPDQAWIDRVRLGSARLAQGCSASFVSPNGLVMTNHHCAHACIEQLSQKGQDFVANGFYAPSISAERKCPALEVNQLVAITDVTDTLRSALAGKTGAAFNDAKNAEKAKLTKACATSDDLRCEVVELYNGGRYNLYQYKRYQDVRLVFAPELAIAFFGGDPDNFNFPRFDLDVAFVRIYSNDKPAETPNYFPFSPSGAQEGELTFVSGNPGHTSREYTVSELLFERRTRLPKRLFGLAELRGLLTEFGKRGAEQKRTSETHLFYVENSFKGLKGREQALLSPRLIPEKRAAEHVLRTKMAKDKRPGFSKAYETIDTALVTYANIFDAYEMLERGRAFDGDLYSFARTLVRAAEELPKPNEARLKEFTDAALPQLRQTLLSPAPVYDDLAILELTFGLTKFREALGFDDPRVRAVLGKKSPATLAAELVRGTKLKNVAVRKQLLEGGKAAVDASKDPMIELARAMDPEARAVRKRFEEEVEGPLSRAHEAIATVRFETHGTSIYPDATFTLRLSYGAVRGWQENGKLVPPFTTIGGAFDRHTGEEPFALPKRWLTAKSRLALDTKLNFVTTNDIIGGNSGSPVINKDAQVVGLIFDGNIHSLGGDYFFDEKLNRAVAVHSSAIVEALQKIYAADRIAQELRGSSAVGAAAP
ncbi:MAG TPA: S46 family peptidase [Polyangiales bacterium]|nr:S46 family peptidase [Polyangiales bacterium]